MNKNSKKFKETDIGFIPEEWKIALLGKCSLLLGGKRLPKGDSLVEYKTHHPYIRITDFLEYGVDEKKIKFITPEVHNKIKKYIINEGDIYISNVGTIGLVGVIKGKMSGANLTENAVRITKFNGVNNYFLYYYLKSTIGQEQIKQNTVGAVQPKLPIYGISNIKIILPDILEQERIAEILSSLDDKIELNRKINSNLEKIASLLFKQWFVDFEFPNENGKPFKSSGGRMIDSELGEIPKGWSIGFLGDNKLTQLVKPGIDEFKGEKIYLPTANVNESSIVDLNYKITYYNRPSRANMQPFPNSIWFAKMKNSKKVQLFLEREKWKLKNVILSTGFTGIRPLSNSTFYIWTIINSDFFEREKSNLAIGTTMQAINNENIRRIRYIIPQKNILDCFEKKVCMLYEAISINKEQIKSFSKIRDSLLPRLMSGKIRVKI